jgi:serine/threonine protein kinase
MQTSHGKPEAAGCTLMSLGDTIHLPSANATELASGLIVDKAYEVIGRIAGGGMGDVYRVRHIIMQKEYALKALTAEHLKEADWRRFQNEGRVIGRLNHPNVVGIANLGVHDNCLPYYVMDLLDGQALSEILEERGSLPLVEALPIFIQVCSGIGYAHKKGIVHRDIKPGNIVVLNDKLATANIKIVDFGIAKLSGLRDQHNQQITQAGELFGSPLYMSPEQCQGIAIDARSDIYSLGCSLYETLTGSPPFKGKNAFETMLMHQNCEPPSLSNSAGGRKFPSMLESIIASTLAKDPRDRYQNMDLLAKDLTLALSGKDERSITHLSQPKKYAALPEVEEERNRILELQKNRVIKMITAIAICLCLSAIAATTASSIGLDQYRRQEQKKTAIKDLSSQPQSPDSTDGDNVNETVFNEVSAYSGDEPFSNQHNASNDDTKPFSVDNNKDGKIYRVFRFPKHASIGLFRHDDSGIFSSVCQGQYVKRPEENLIFVPSKGIEKIPQYLKRFRAGDIYGIEFVSELVDDKTLEACTNIPGVRMLIIGNSLSLTKKDIQSVNKFKELEDFRCQSGSFNVQDLISMPRFKHLKRLAFSGPGLSTVLSALTKASTLEDLDLSAASVKSEDFAVISGIKSLRFLTIQKAKITSNKINALARLPHLQKLTIWSCEISPEALGQLKRLQNFRYVGANNGGLSALSLNEFKASINAPKFE